MKNPNAILMVTGAAVLALLLVFTRCQHSRAKVSSPAGATPITFTDTNGNQFTVYIAGEIVNGTNIIVSNLNVNARAHQPGAGIRQQTNATSK